MNWKRGFAAICVAVVAYSMPVFAQEQSTITQNTQAIQYVSKEVNIRNGTVTFTTKCTEHRRDWRCYAEGEITIKESKAGLLQDGDVIYFETSKDGDRYATNDGGYLEIEAKGVSAETVKIEDEQEAQNHFAVRISRENKKELAEIHIKFVFYFGGYYDNTDEVIFSLSLDTDKTKEKNLFAEVEDNLLNDKFLTLLCRNWDKEAQELKQSLPQMVFTVGKDTMLWNGQQKQLKHRVYINQNGAAMLSMQDFADIVEDIRAIRDINKVHLHMSYDEDDILAYIVVGKDSFFIDFKENTIKELGSMGENVIENVTEQKEGVSYLTLRSVAALLGMENNTVWDNASKTVTIKKNME